MEYCVSSKMPEDEKYILAPGIDGYWTYAEANAECIEREKRSPHMNHHIFYLDKNGDWAG